MKKDIWTAVLALGVALLIALVTGGKYMKTINRIIIALELLAVAFVAYAFLVMRTPYSVARLLDWLAGVANH